jgi:hypothetical protein
MSACGVWMVLLRFARLRSGGLPRKEILGFRRLLMDSLCGMFLLIGGICCVRFRAVTDLLFSAVCLEQVDRAHEIRQLRCLHVFHRECLEKWFLGDHFNCPLCHRAYYASNTPPRNDYVWMV